MESDWTPDARLRVRVDEVLHYLWDPIGVSHAPEARDEYYAYSAHAFEMLKNGANADEIAAYLRGVRVERMCMGRGTERTGEKEIAEVLIRWKNVISDEFP